MKTDRAFKDEMYKMVEDHLGDDADKQVVREVARYMEECPECKIYVDSVHDTIKLYRVTKDDDSIPNDVSERLFKKLKLKP